MGKKKASGAVDYQVLLDELEARLSARKKAEAEADGSEPLRVIWEDWARKVVSRHPSEDGARSDRKAVHVHRAFILDMPFEYGGERLRLGDVRALQITLLMAEAWRSELQLQRKFTRGTPRAECVRVKKDGTWNRGNGGSLAPSYRNRVINTLQTLISWKHGKVGNPTHGLSRESVEGYEREGWFQSEEHLEEWLQHACLQYQRIARTVCVSSGACRLTEARLLMEHEVTWDPAVRQIYLPHGRVKNRKGKKFEVSSAAYATLESLRRVGKPCADPHCEVRANPKMAPNNWDKHVHLFALQSVSDGRAPSDSTVSDWARTASKHWEKEVGKERARLGPKKERPTTHHLRHTGGTWHYLRSGDILAVKRKGGWTSSVVERYMHQGDEMIEAAAALADMSIEEAIRRRGGGAPAEPAPEAPKARNARRPRAAR